MTKALPLPGTPDFPERFRRLTALEQAQALARGKRRHERDHPRASHGGDRRSAAFHTRSECENHQQDTPDPQRYGFTNFAARVLGCTARSIQVTVRIAETHPTGPSGRAGRHTHRRAQERPHPYCRHASGPPSATARMPGGRSPACNPRQSSLSDRPESQRPDGPPWLTRPKSSGPMQPGTP